MIKWKDINIPDTTGGIKMQRLSEFACSFKDCGEPCAYFGNGNGFAFLLCIYHYESYKVSNMKIQVNKKTGSIILSRLDPVDPVDPVLQND